MSDVPKAAPDEPWFPGEPGADQPPAPVDAASDGIKAERHAAALKRAVTYGTRAKGGLMRRVANCTEEQRRWYAAGIDALLAAQREGERKYAAEARHYKLLAGGR